MKSMTVVVQFEDGQEPERVSFGDKVLGGKVTAMAAYDVMHVIEIAEDALGELSDDRCREALEQIEQYIVQSISWKSTE